ncbi:FxSxx-COOH system tetratricopeptide repeat protein [Nocardia sp. NPDC049737]|uniref:FxSxx-COOH system tetratricopeptide repeat protein n=1 Tax=Nocardia sp. NPDC049737 TaxID=3154358 RepID=UPI00344066AD
MRQLLAARDIQSVFQFLHSRGWSWAAIARATDLGDQRVREIASGRRKIESYDVFVRIAEGLDIPKPYLGLGLDDPESPSAPALGHVAGTAELEPRVLGQHGGQAPRRPRETTPLRADIPTASVVTGWHQPEVGPQIEVGVDVPSDAIGSTRSSVPRISNLPSLTLNFVGRQDVLAAVEQNLDEQLTAAVVQTIAISGMGGVGKTQLALAYAYRNLARYELIWWIPAERSAVVAESLHKLAIRLGVYSTDTHSDSMGPLRDWLRAHDNWLMIYDNVEDPRDLMPFRPADTRGHIIVTSRNPSWRGYATTIKVDVLERFESVEFLLSRTGTTDRVAADKIAEILGDLPLALEQAGAYIEESNISLMTYLELVQSRGAAMSRQGRPANHEDTVATTWSISLQKLCSISPSAELLLNLLSHLSAEGVDRNMLLRYAATMPETLRPALSDPLQFNAMLSAASRYSIVNVSETSLSMHRLVQLVIRESLSAGQGQQWSGAAVRLLAAAFPEDVTDIANWGECARLLPHALTVLDHSVSQRSELHLAQILVGHVSRYLAIHNQYGQAQLRQARWISERTVDIATSLGEEDSRSVATSLNSLGLVQRDLGELEKARVAHTRALEIFIRLVGERDPEVAATLNAIGLVHHASGRLDEAEAAYLEALSITEEAYGTEHPTVARTLSNLGRVHRAMRRLDQALAEQERGLSIRIAWYGNRHADVGWSLDGLGLTKAALGMLDGAEIDHRKAEGIFTDAYGDSHPYTARCLDGLGRVLFLQGRPAAARDVHERALRILDAYYDPQHPHIARCVRGLAEAEVGLGNKGKAVGLLSRAYEIDKLVFGEAHPLARRLEAEIKTLAS